MLKIERTGNGYSIASSEFLATFPDGTTQTIWSPVWNDYTEQEEEENALRYANKLWKEKQFNEDILPKAKMAFERTWVYLIDLFGPKQEETDVFIDRLKQEFFKDEENYLLE